MNWHLCAFWLLASCSVLSALLLVANRNPVRSALWLIANMLVLSVVYLTLSAQFVAAAQVIVYAGAIMVLFLFVIMLLNLSGAEPLKERGGFHQGIAVVLAVCLLAAIGGAGSLSRGLAKGNATAATLAKGGTAEQIGFTLFDPSLPWVLPFEVTSVLLLMGLVGAVVLAKRKV